MRTYIETLAEYYPGLKLMSYGDGQTYDQLVFANPSTAPSKATLDTQRLQLTQERMWRRIQAERDRRRANGVKVGPYWFHTDDTSRIQHIGLVLMGANLPPNIMWKTMSGDFIQMTPTLAGQIFQSVAAQDIAIFTVAEQKRAQMMMLPDPDTFNPVTGWPPTFGE